MNYKGQFPTYQFSEIQRLNPYWSSLVCFHEAIKNKKSLHPRLIRKHFNTLVEKDDYASEDKSEVVNYAIKLASGEA